MQTPEETAMALVNKFKLQVNAVIDPRCSEIEWQYYDKAGKSCALLFVDEILNGVMIWNAIDGDRRIFWNKVKEELEKL